MRSDCHGATLYALTWKQLREPAYNPSATAGTLHPALTITQISELFYGCRYCLPNGDSGIIRTLDAPVYITRVFGNIIYCLDRDGKNRQIQARSC